METWRKAVDILLEAKNNQAIQQYVDVNVNMCMCTLTIGIILLLVGIITMAFIINKTVEQDDSYQDFVDCLIDVVVFDYMLVAMVSFLSLAAGIVMIGMSVFDIIQWNTNSSGMLIKSLLSSTS